MRKIKANLVKELKENGIRKVDKLVSNISKAYPYSDIKTLLPLGVTLKNTTEKEREEYYIQFIEGVLEGIIEGEIYPQEFGINKD